MNFQQLLLIPKEIEVILKKQILIQAKLKQFEAKLDEIIENTKPMKQTLQQITDEKLWLEEQEKLNEPVNLYKV